jgi:hypothetical protein
MIAEIAWVASMCLAPFAALAIAYGLKRVTR